MLDLDARGALLLAGWVLLNLLLNFFNKWALSPMVVELSWGGSLIHESLRGPSNGAGFSFPLFYSMCHMAASFFGAGFLASAFFGSSFLATGAGFHPKLISTPGRAFLRAASPPSETLVCQR